MRQAEEIIGNDEVKRSYNGIEKAMEAQLTNNVKLNTLLPLIEKRVNLP